jgi:hypothetical protein
MHLFKYFIGPITYIDVCVGEGQLPLNVFSIIYFYAIFIFMVEINPFKVVVIWFRYAKS